MPTPSETSATAIDEGQPNIFLSLPLLGRV